MGELLSKILKRNKNIKKGILFDLPNVIETAKSILIDNNEKNKIEFISGDFFRGIPTKADTIILSRVLHDWDDGKATTILKHVNASLEENGKLLIFETIVPENCKVDMGTTLNFDLLVCVGGKERTLQEFNNISLRYYKSFLHSAY